MSEQIWAPILAIVYLVLMVWYSTIMAKVLNTNLVVLILLGIFLPPIWIIVALVSLSYQMGEHKSPKRQSPKRQSPKRQSPKRQSPKRQSPKRQSPKRESPKRESPKRESPKRESPKRESS